MISNVSLSVKHLLVHEGGWTIDSGGPTMWGVTQRVYDPYRASKGLVRRSVRLISQDEVADIYKHLYWDHIQADLLPTGIDYTIFDEAVNSGPTTAIRAAQRVLNSMGAKLRVDGVMGPLTIQTLNDQFPGTFIKKFCEYRVSWLHSLRTWRIYGAGWKARVLGRQGEPGVLQNAIAMLSSQAQTKAEATSIDTIPPMTSAQYAAATNAPAQ